VTKCLLLLTLVACATRAFSLSKQITFDCGELGPGATQTYVDTFPVKSKFASQVLVSVDASNTGTEKAPKCHVKWTISGKLAGRTKVLFQHEISPQHNSNGGEFGGASADGTKLLFDFFDVVNDRTSHRPAVFDFLTGAWEVRDLADRLTHDFPNCNYFTMIDRVTDEGDVVLSVPKSIYVRQGCPDRGEWLLHMKTDEITRLTKPDAPPPQIKAPAPH
jgi:hypothetical protein